MKTTYHYLVTVNDSYDGMVYFIQQQLSVPEGRNPVRALFDSFREDGDGICVPEGSINPEQKCEAEEKRWYPISSIVNIRYSTVPVEIPPRVVFNSGKNKS